MVRFTGNVICTICARGGSKGVKNKNVRMVGGKPMLAYTVEQAKESKLFEHIVVSSDSVDIQESARSFGADIFFTRSEELSSDTAGKIGVIRDTLIRSEEHYGKQFDVLVDLDVTSPLRTPNDIVNAYSQFLADDNSNLITAVPARRSPYFNLIERFQDGTIGLSKKPDRPIVRRQDAPACFDMNASIYIWKRDVLLTQNTLFLSKTGLYVMPEERSLDVDSEFDFEIVSYLLKKRIPSGN